MSIQSVAPSPAPAPVMLAWPRPARRRTLLSFSPVDFDDSSDNPRVLDVVDDGQDADDEGRWATLLDGEKTRTPPPPTLKSKSSAFPREGERGCHKAIGDRNPFASSATTTTTTTDASTIASSSPSSLSSLNGLMSSSSNNLTSSPRKEQWHRAIRQLQERKEEEVRSILAELESLQHEFVSPDRLSHDDIDDDDYDDNDDHDIDVRRDCPRGKEYAVLHYPNGDLFSGNVDGVTREPVYGRMTHALEMEVYEGPFRDGMRHGRGATCAKVDGSAKFLGRYAGGEMHSGTLIVASSSSSSGGGDGGGKGEVGGGGRGDYAYTGTFVDNDFHGVGTMVSGDGSIYQGRFANGQYHGVGELRKAEKVGENDDADDGRGRRKEVVYVGDFVEGEFHGHGTLTKSDGSSYVGSWREGKRSTGIETLVNGDVFEGSFVNDLREGRGVLRTKGGGMTICGVWEAGKLKDGVEVCITYADGHCYCGDHADSVPHGFGRIDYADKGSIISTYTGWFVNGVRQGMGKCSFHKTGEEYEGEWACDEPIGLKIFQHQGPFIEMSHDVCSHCIADGEGGGGREGTHFIPQTLSFDNRPRRRRTMGSYELSSSTESFCDGPCCRVMDESVIALSENAMTHASSSKPNNAVIRTKLRLSVESDINSSMKSLSVFDHCECIKLYKYQNGDTYEGNVDRVSGMRQGSGVYTEHRMRSTYNGDWRDSKRHGTGHLKLASGGEYTGEFFMDNIQGQGKLTLGGVVYTGSFYNGLFHGRGMLENVGHGRVYFGGFENGERSGEGEETHLDETRYKGEYKFGKRNGFGVLFGPDGSEVYRGEWNEGLRHGKGTLKGGSTGAGIYDGDFFQDKVSGRGKYTYTDGTSIEGQWLDDVPRDGDWSIVYPDGSKFYGFATFQRPLEEKPVAPNGYPLRRSTYDSPDFLRVPLPHGFGSLTHPNGWRYVGSFRYGERE
ncbi:hypothetical protein ACHAW5_000235 [Stephanodiscus triporus]|uniref:MORN repeat-containing protein 5 n=1 Tax=Stephanodiscus triporus TaxID=2934178 RepID=A0ABD3NHW4_9STRA